MVVVSAGRTPRSSGVSPRELTQPGAGRTRRRSPAPPARRRVAGRPPAPANPAEPLTTALPVASMLHPGLAATEPSFLAPLGHRVDPSAGGLVNGLASVRPAPSIPYAAATALAVPSRASRANVQRHSPGDPSRSYAGPSPRGAQDMRHSSRRPVIQPCAGPGDPAAPT